VVQVAPIVNFTHVAPVHVAGIQAQAGTTPASLNTSTGGNPSLSSSTETPPTSSPGTPLNTSQNGIPSSNIISLTASGTPRRRSYTATPQVKKSHLDDSFWIGVFIFGIVDIY